MSSSNPNPHAFVTVFVGSVAIEVDAERNVVVNTDGAVQLRQPTTEPATAAAPEEVAPEPQVTPATPQVGDRAPDGSVFAGLTPDGRMQIFAMPTDLGFTATFNEAAAAVKALNATKALGHDDWQIPTQETLRVLYENRKTSALRGTFQNTFGHGDDFPSWYWASTQHRVFSSFVQDLHFAGGYGGWNHKHNGRLSCRPVRVVPVKTPGAAS